METNLKRIRQGPHEPLYDYIAQFYVEAKYKDVLIEQGRGMKGMLLQNQPSKILAKCKAPSISFGDSNHEGGTLGP
ncbi:hypothetical protein CR513_61864, partial [Mucuna pruriens]